MLHQVEDHVHHRQEERDAQPAMRDHAVQAIGQIQARRPRLADDLARQSAHETIALIGDGNIHFIAEELAQTALAALHRLLHGLAINGRRDLVKDAGLAFQEFDGQPAR